MKRALPLAELSPAPNPEYRKQVNPIHSKQVEGSGPETGFTSILDPDSTCSGFFGLAPNLA